MQHEPPRRLPRRPFVQRRLKGFDYSDPTHPYFVTVCAHEDAPSRPFEDERIAAEVIASLNWLRENRGVSIYAYCIMPDHIHLLLQLSSSSGKLGDVVGAMKKHTTTCWWKLGFSGRLWQDLFHDRIVRRSDDARSIARYILYNPVRKGLVVDPEQYRWNGTPDPME